MTGTGHDRIRATIRIAATRELAFDVFTVEIDSWWRRGKKYRRGEPSTLALEPRVGGRLIETVQTSQGPRIWQMGEVLVWDPPKRLLLSWRAANFGAQDPSTEVEVNFERAIGHSGEGTLVTVEHRGWSRVRPDHPVRHGRPAREFIVSTGTWWAELVGAFREYASQPR